MTHELGYFTEVGLGTPPQYFRVLVDISAADSFVISSEYPTPAGGSPQYNSSPSSAYREDGVYGLTNASGFVSQDILHFGGLQILNQLFEEATNILERSILG